MKKNTIKRIMGKRFINESYKKLRCFVIFRIYNINFSFEPKVGI